MGTWWVADLFETNRVLLVSWVVWVIGSIVLHELAHGWAAIWRGDRTPIELGHMTWNPLVHMGPMSLIVFALVGIAWGMMPVNPSRFRGRYDDALVSAAGPAMNLALAAFALVATVVWVGAAGGYWFGTSVDATLYQNMKTFFMAGVMLNLVLAMFNLLPVPPLDGSRILATFHPPYGRVFESEQGQVLGLFLFLGVFFFGGQYLFGTAFNLSDTMVDALLGVFVPSATRP